MNLPVTLVTQKTHEPKVEMIQYMDKDMGLQLAKEA